LANQPKDVNGLKKNKRQRYQRDVEGMHKAKESAQSVLGEFFR
jgi:hypothetical protein